MISGRGVCYNEGRVGFPDRIFFKGGRETKVEVRKYTSIDSKGMENSFHAAIFGHYALVPEKVGPRVVYPPHLAPGGATAPAAATTTPAAKTSPAAASVPPDSLTAVAGADLFSKTLKESGSKVTFATKKDSGVAAGSATKSAGGLFDGIGED